MAPATRRLLLLALLARGTHSFTAHRSRTLRRRTLSQRAAATKPQKQATTRESSNGVLDPDRAAAKAAAGGARIVEIRDFVQHLHGDEDDDGNDAAATAIVGGSGVQAFQHEVVITHKSDEATTTTGTGAADLAALSLVQLKDVAASMDVEPSSGHKGHKATWVQAITEAHQQATTHRSPPSSTAASAAAASTPVATHATSTPAATAGGGDASAVAISDDAAAESPEGGGVDSSWLFPRVALLAMAAVCGTNFPLVKDLEEVHSESSVALVRFALAALPFLGSLQCPAPVRNAGLEIGAWCALGYITQAIGLHLTEVRPSVRSFVRSSESEGGGLCVMFFRPSVTSSVPFRHSLTHSLIHISPPQRFRPFPDSFATDLLVG